MMVEFIVRLRQFGKKMSKHTVKEWMIAVRPWSFPASVMPVAVTLGYLAWRGAQIDWLCGVLAIVNIVLFHAAGNTWSDYFDYKRGVDAHDTYGAKTLTDNMFTPKEIYKLSIGLLVVALILGAVLMVLSSWQLIWFGLAGALLTILYPKLKYSALGDVDIILTYAVLPTLGTSYVATGVVDYSVLLVAVPLGLITDSILHANNTRDMETDKRAGISTFAMKIGIKRSVYLYCMELIIPYLWVIVCGVCGYLPWWSLLVLVAIKPAYDNINRANSRLKGNSDAFAILDEASAKLQLMFSLLLIVSFVVSLVIAALVS